MFLSTLIGEEIQELTFRPTEHRSDVEQRSVTVFRMDFAARIALPGGGEKLVILEIQKAKFAADIMRFRKYLGSQYASKENVYDADDRQRALPILTIFFLGHALEHSHCPVIRVMRKYLDGAGKALDGPREEFIESLTHDSIIVQIPHLNERRQNDIECLLGIFDQTQKDPQDAHTLSIREEDYPKKFQPVIRRLIKAISERLILASQEAQRIGEFQDRQHRVMTASEKPGEAFFHLRIAWWVIPTAVADSRIVQPSASFRRISLRHPDLCQIFGGYSGNRLIRLRSGSARRFSSPWLIGFPPRSGCLSPRAGSRTRNR